MSVYLFDQVGREATLLELGWSGGDVPAYAGTTDGVVTEVHDGGDTDTRTFDDLAAEGQVVVHEQAEKVGVVLGPQVMAHESAA